MISPPWESRKLATIRHKNLEKPDKFQLAPSALAYVRLNVVVVVKFHTFFKLNNTDDDETNLKISRKQ